MDIYTIGVWAIALLFTLAVGWISGYWHRYKTYERAKRLKIAALKKNKEHRKIKKLVKGTKIIPKQRVLTMEMAEESRFNAGVPSGWEYFKEGYFIHVLEGQAKQLYDTGKVRIEANDILKLDGDLIAKHNQIQREAVALKAVLENVLVATDDVMIKEFIKEEFKELGLPLELQGKGLKRTMKMELMEKKEARESAG
jgi:hypothetical protein